MQRRQKQSTERRSARVTLVSRRLQDRLARWWNMLNVWEIPQELMKHQHFFNEEERRQFIRGAFTIVDKIAGRSGLALWRKENALRRNGRKE